MNGNITDELSSIQELLDSGKYNDAYDLICHLETKKRSDEQSIKLLSWKSTILGKIGNYDEVIEVLDHGIKLADHNNLLNQQYNFIYSKASTFHSMGKYENALSYLDNQLKNLKEDQIQNLSLQMANIANIQAICHWALGRINEAKKNYEKSLELFVKIGSKKDIGMVTGNIGILYSISGEHETALTYFRKAIDIADDVKNEGSKGSVFTNMAIAVFKLGRSEEALEYHQKALEIYQKGGHLQNIAAAFHNMSEIYIFRGELDTAITNLNKSLEIKHKLGNDQHTAMSLHVMATIYKNKGQFDKALEFINEAYELKKLYTNYNSIAISLFELISILLSSGRLTIAKKYYTEFVRLSEDNPDIPTLQLMYQIISASVSQYEMTDNQDGVLILFEELLKEKMELSLYLFVLVSYIQIKSTLLANTQNVGLLGDIESKILKLNRIALENKSFVLYIQAIILKSKLEILKWNLIEAENLLNSAAEFATEKGLTKFHDEIETNHKNLLTTLNTTIKETKEDPSLLYLIREADLVDYITKIHNGRNNAWAGLSA